jgi:hypothetical protein
MRSQTKSDIAFTGRAKSDFMSNLAVQLIRSNQET